MASHATDKDFVLVKYEHDRDHEIALNEFTHNLEMEQLKLLILLNGGAATALLTFAEHSSAAPWLMIAVGIWLIGLLIGAFATFIMRRGQSAFAKFYRHHRNATEFRRIAGAASLPRSISDAELEDLEALASQEPTVRRALDKKDDAFLHERLARFVIAGAREDNRRVHRLSYFSLGAFIMGAIAAAGIVISAPSPADAVHKAEVKASAPGH
jgi:hypothetical protein